MAKEKTRGQKQILEENKSTVQFYTMASLIVMSFYLLMMMFVFPESFTATFMVLSCFSGLVYGGCIVFMKWMAQAKYSETGALVDGGIDLNLKEGVSEYVKDLIILTALVQLLSLVHNYFWFLWLAAPGFASYQLWVKLIAPWVFAPAPEVDEAKEDKKQKKLDRRMKRMQ